MKTDKKVGYIKTFEEFKKDPATKIEEAFLKLKTDVEGWFKEGTLSQEKDVALLDCIINTRSTQPTLSFDFSTPNNYFEIILKGDMENLTNDEEEKTFLLEIKKFDTEKAEMIDRKEVEVSEGEFTEDFFLQLVAKSEE